MTQRERVLAIGVLGAVVVGGAAFLFHSLVWAPLQELDTNIGLVQKDVDQKEQRLREIQAAKLRMERWKLLSLPDDQELSRREYEFYLTKLLRDSGFAPGFFANPKPVEKSPEVMKGRGSAYTRLPYRISGKATLNQLVDLLEHFYQTGLLHQIRHLQVQRPPGNNLSTQQQNLLDVRMDVEALMVAGAEGRPQLLPALSRRLLTIDVVAALQKGPTGLGLAVWGAGPTGQTGPGVLARRPEQYTAISKKNIFLGTPQPERTAEIMAPPRFIRLTDISDNSQKCEAFLFDRLNNITTRLRAETGFDTFQVVGDDGKILVRGKIIRLDSRDIYFQFDEDYYRMHVGEDLETVLNNPLTGEQLKGLGLSAVAKETSKGN